MSSPPPQTRHIGLQRYANDQKNTLGCFNGATNLDLRAIRWLCLIMQLQYMETGAMMSEYAVHILQYCRTNQGKHPLDRKAEGEKLQKGLLQKGKLTTQEGGYVLAHAALAYQRNTRLLPALQNLGKSKT